MSKKDSDVGEEAARGYRAQRRSGNVRELVLLLVLLED
jgi:hypothetical protein